jgi:membrane protein implicated in regulation of membrane protease activity
MLLRTVLLMFAGVVVCTGLVGLVLTHWTVGIIVILAAGVLAVVVWLAFGTGRRSPVDPDETDEDPERQKTMQYYVRSTRMPPH